MSDNAFLFRDTRVDGLSGEIWGLEIRKPDGSNARFGIAGADGKAEQARVAAEQGRASAEAARASAETRREEAERAREAAERTRADQQSKNNADQQANNAAAQGLQVVKLTTGQFDPSTLKPTVQGEVGKLYFVPDAKRGDGNLYREWMSIDGAWEQVGMSTAAITGLTTGQIDTVAGDGTVTSESVLNGTGLTYLWGKLKAKFAALSHTHRTSDVDGLDAALSDKATKAEVEEVRKGVIAYDLESSVTDLNKLTGVGIYSVNNASNKPSGASGWVNVLVIPINGGGSYTSQLLITMDGSAHVRAQKGGQWTSWKQL